MMPFLCDDQPIPHLQLPHLVFVHQSVLAIVAQSNTVHYNPATGTSTRTGQFGVAPSWIGHTLTLIGTGQAQVAGGRDKYSITSYSRLYDWPTNSWPSTSAGHMNNVREFHTATLLPNGQVLVAGGYFISNGTVTQLASAELYTP